jgi:hypothetical protein
MMNIRCFLKDILIFRNTFIGWHIFFEIIQLAVKGLKNHLVEHLPMSE